MSWAFLRQLGAMTLIVSCYFAAAPCMAEENWPQWRGPQANGVAAGTGYPVKWSTSENIVWRYKLPGLGASTPILWGDHIVVTGENQGSNSVLCLNRAGEKRWEVNLGKEVPARNRKASGSNPSPVTDGQSIFVYFKSGDLACLGLGGQVVWRKNLQETYGRDTLWWDLGTSPVLTENLVVVVCMQSGNSYLAGFDKRSGETVWKQDRNVDSPGESAQSYTTPVVVDQEDTEIIIVLGADHVTAHDAATGKQVWIATGLNPGGRQNWRSISSPVVVDGQVIAPYGRGSSLTAIRLGGQGDVTKSHLVWSNDGPAADVPTPAASNGRVFICADSDRRGAGVAMLDAKTGNTLANARFGQGRETFSASPVLAGQHLYVTSEAGATYVYKVGPQELKLVAENQLEDFTVATPIFSDRRAYLRTDAYLWCVGTE